MGGATQRMQWVRAPVDEGEQAAHVGDKELLGRRGVRADRAERVDKREIGKKKREKKMHEIAQDATQW
jgi:hypothetical protein